jgi:hypothetical protein
MIHHDSCVSIDEFRNFLQQIDFKLKDEEELKETMDEICNWASYRGQTLTRTGKMSSAIL